MDNSTSENNDNAIITDMISRFEDKTLYHDMSSNLRYLLLGFLNIVHSDLQRDGDYSHLASTLVSYAMRRISSVFSGTH